MPDGGWDWPKQGTADEANLSPADFTQQHVSTWLWPGPRAQTGYEGLLGQTCGSQNSYLMLKKKASTKLTKYHPLAHACKRISKKPKTFIKFGRPTLP